MKLSLDILGWLSVGVIVTVITLAFGLVLHSLIVPEPLWAAAWLGIGFIVGLANRVLWKYTNLWGNKDEGDRSW